jgi:hypothetical protein
MERKLTESVQEVKPHFKWVKIDETRHWVEEWRKKNNVKKVVSTFIFNANEITHCCEITPSYWLEHLESYAQLDVDTDSMSEEEFDAFLEESNRVEDEIRDEEIQNNNDMYVHCHEVDGKVGHILEVGELGEPGEFEDMEEARECAQGSPP